MNSYGYVTHLSAWTPGPLASLAEVFQSCESSKSREMNVLLVEAVVKGYLKCPFTVRTGEAFSREKKIGCREEAFRVVNCENGQL